MQRAMEVLGWFKFTVSDYAFYLLIISALCFALERVFPWRKEQRALRKGFFQDLGWLALNGHILGALLWRLKSALWEQTGLWPFFQKVEGMNVLAQTPLLVQLVVLVVLKDFIEYWVHRSLHRFVPLWELHKVHHSIRELDFAGNFRFHVAETLIYQTVTYLPLALMGFRHEAVMGMAIFTTLIGHFNHSNLNITWGPLRYVLNSPRLHVWHHDVLVVGDHGRNFGVVFSAWDWLFGTAHMPEGQPQRLGFAGDEEFPESLAGRFFYPLSGRFRSKPSPT